MRTPLEIIGELKHVTYWSQPNIKFHETMALLNELETSLNPVEETIEEDIPQIPEPEFPQEGQIVLMKDENGIYEEYLVGEVAVEEPVTETQSVEKPVAKKPTVKKTAPKK
jgi:hypothetical protein